MYARWTVDEGQVLMGYGMCDADVNIFIPAKNKGFCSLAENYAKVILVHHLLPLVGVALHFGGSFLARSLD